ncbi:MAG: thiamine pyrophosphate-dependent dehydrogenase E1 component subunit alpha [Chloroflexota bacterium]
MNPDVWLLYAWMLKSRLFEQAVARLWQEGKISGEMHLGLGEEAIVAGILTQLQEGDALALDHRGTPSMLMRGVDPVALLRELLGRPDGLCGGMGGHMHLFSPEHLAASSGIVGSAGPIAVGFALAAQMLRPGTVAVAFFGDGAINQGMLLESLNLASIWKLPVLLVCKDNRWAITTQSATVTSGHPLERARGFGLEALEVDGRDVLMVWDAVHQALGRARAGDGPTFLLASCAHLEGHFLGDPLLDMLRKPGMSIRKRLWPLLREAVRLKGASLQERVSAVTSVMSKVMAVQDQRSRQNDPLERARQMLVHRDKARLLDLESSTRLEIQQIVTQALATIEESE